MSISFIVASHVDPFPMCPWHARSVARDSGEFRAEGVTAEWKQLEGIAVTVNVDSVIIMVISGLSQVNEIER